MTAATIQIRTTELDGDDGLIVTFSDGTTGAYVVEELLELRPVRERVNTRTAPKPSKAKPRQRQSTHKWKSPPARAELCVRASGKQQPPAGSNQLASAGPPGDETSQRDRGVSGDIGVYQHLSKQDLCLSTLKVSTVCGPSTSPNQQVCLPGSNFRMGDNPPGTGKNESVPNLNERVGLLAPADKKNRFQARQSWDGLCGTTLSPRTAASSPAPLREPPFATATSHPARRSPAY